MSPAGDVSRAELMMMTIADVIQQLVEAHEEGKDINLNKQVLLLHTHRVTHVLRRPEDDKATV